MRCSHVSLLYPENQGLLEATEGRPLISVTSSEPFVSSAHADIAELIVLICESRLQPIAISLVQLPIYFLAHPLAILNPYDFWFLLVSAVTMNEDWPIQASKRTQKQPKVLQVVQINFALYSKSSEAMQKLCFSVCSQDK